MKIWIEEKCILMLSTQFSFLHVEKDFTALVSKIMWLRDR